MVSPTVSMAIPPDFAPFSPSAVMSWMQQSVAPPQTPFKLFTPPINPYLTQDLTVNASSQQIRRKQSYKHVPHKDKPPHLVARRNARERRRVQAVNSAFARLRKCVPIENRNKRLSKVKTLHRAIDYIKNLQMLLSDNSLSTADYDRFEDLDDEIKEESSEIADFEYLESDSVNKENHSSLSTGCESNYWTYNMPYHEGFPGSLPS